MAIKRLNPTARYKVISEHDDALVYETAEEFDALATGQLDADGNKIYGLNRFQRYLEAFDESILKFKEGETPTRFQIRLLTSSEQAEINEKYFVADTKSKTFYYKNRGQMMIDIFKIACEGIVEADGKLTKITVDELALGNVLAIGSMVTIAAALSTDLKKS